MLEPFSVLQSPLLLNVLGDRREEANNHEGSEQAKGKLEEHPRATQLHEQI
jgi:hypothetical protein